jgi:hypothetical protein
MRLSKTEIEIAKKNNSQFVSLKYVENNAELKQIDVFVNNLEKEFLVCRNDINLKPIDNKNFIDPFRSLSTTSFFCENIANKYNSRKLATELLSKADEKFKSSFCAEISFWISGENNAQNNYEFIANPIDKYTNLRSDIISTLEGINIKTSVHIHGSTHGESIITIKGNDVVDLSDNIIITKFIIANIADSYGFTAQFNGLDNKITNLSLVIEGNNNDMDKLLYAMQKNIGQTSSFTSLDSVYGFELVGINSYKITSENVVVKISLICKNEFIPYFAFAKLLLIQSTQKTPK